MIKDLKIKLIKKKAYKSEKKLQQALKKESETLVEKFDNSIISWETPEYIKYKKSWVWYAVFVALMVVSVVVAYLYFSKTFAMVLFTFIFSYIIFDLKIPRKITISISDLGIKVGNKVYQFGRIRAFWIVYNPPIVQSLYIRVHNEFIRDVEIQLYGIDPTEVYNFLATKIPELEGKDESVLKGITRLFKI